MVVRVTGERWPSRTGCDRKRVSWHDVNDEVTTLSGWLRDARAITVLSGAGISTQSGIPDFRGPQGVWTKDPSAAALSTIDSYVSDPEVRKRSWQARRDHPAWHARPNSAHEALVDLERAGKLHAVITQNIDELHQRAGSDRDKVIEVHGTMFGVDCLECGERSAMADALERVAAGEEDPRCRTCGGLLKSATISFGQALRPEVLDAAADAARACDVFLAVGSSLTVHPVAGFCMAAIEHGARLIVVNAEETPYDRVADGVLQAPVEEALPDLVQRALVV